MKEFLTDLVLRPKDLFLIVKDVLLILIELLALGMIVWQTRKTFKNERKLTTTHFLQESQLNSTVVVLENINSIESCLDEVNKNFQNEVNDRKEIIKTKKSNKRGTGIFSVYTNCGDEYINQFKKTIKKLDVPINNIELYINFIPSLEQDFDLFKTLKYYYEKECDIFFNIDKEKKNLDEDDLSSIEIDLEKIDKKQEQLIKQLFKLKNQLISSYSKIVEKLNNSLNK